MELMRAKLKIGKLSSFIWNFCQFVPVWGFRGQNGDNGKCLTVLIKKDSGTKGTKKSLLSLLSSFNDFNRLSAKLGKKKEKGQTDVLFLIYNLLI